MRMDGVDGYLAIIFFLLYCSLHFIFCPLKRLHDRIRQAFLLLVINQVALVLKKLAYFF